MLDNVTARLANYLLTRLRNRRDLALSREEFRESSISFSQFGEDLLILSYLAKRPRRGVYVDVGAFHPVKLSNTALLYKMGWQGINVDLDSEKIELFKRMRPRDYNVSAAVSHDARKVRVARYPMRAANRIVAGDGSSSSDVVSVCGESPVEIAEMNTTTLTEILDSSPYRNREIDYLNVDCEGEEMGVLQGLVFEKYRPYLICVEALESARRCQLEQFLESLDYAEVGVMGHNLLFESRTVL